MKVNGHFIINKNGKLERIVECKQLKFGWTVSEVICFSIINPRAVSKGSKSIIIGK